jgi:hypothetical protein
MSVSNRRFVRFKLAPVEENRNEKSALEKGTQQVAYVGISIITGLYGVDNKVPHLCQTF